MRRLRYFYLLLLLCIFTSILCVGALFDRSNVAPVGPRIVLPDEIRIPEQESGSVVEVGLPVQNLGDQTAVLDSFRSSCGCASIEFVEEGRRLRAERLELGAGRRADLCVRIAVKAMVGAEMHVGVTARTNDPARPQVVTRFVVDRVLGGVATRPTSVAFGGLVVGAESRQLLRVFDGGKSGRKIEAVESSRPDRFTCRQLPLPESEERNDRLGRLIALVEVVPKSDVPGILDGDVVVRLAGEERLPDVVPVTGRVRDVVEVSPPSLKLPGSSQTGVRWVGRTLCRSYDGSALTLSLVEAPDGLLVRVMPVAAAGDTVIVEVERQANGLPKQPSVGPIRLRAVTGTNTKTIEIKLLCGEADSQ